MAHIKVLNLDNACSLSELSCEDINIVRGGYAATLYATKSPIAARVAYDITLIRTGSRVLAWVASLSTSD
ncbi:hypothetical protein [Nostoc sp. JL23]|uniref:hypothetical protein n=1 Tax=Nostoc sp. JL23 TaxID=2815394 RepID=UPI001E0CAC05|nr:hypothetical protein [Nostoc sp. JL23]MBN3880807.1 hypothetical protein [Nostoc sp. JL23]